MSVVKIWPVTLEALKYVSQRQCHRKIADTLDDIVYEYLLRHPEFAPALLNKDDPEHVQRPAQAIANMIDERISYCTPIPDFGSVVFANGEFVWQEDDEDCLGVRFTDGRFLWTGIEWEFEPDDEVASPPEDHG